MICTVIGNGRMVADPQDQKLSGDNRKVTFRIAVDRGISQEKRDAGKQSADFFSAIVWGRTADYALANLKKGDKIGFRGDLRNREYEHEGVKKQATEIEIDKLERHTARTESETGQAATAAPASPVRRTPTPAPAMDESDPFADE